MIRGIAGTILWASLAGAVGIGLFFVKHEVKDLETRLADINQQVARNQEEMHVLRAEWAYLNDPARLRELAEKHLAMHPIGINQVAASLDALPGTDAPPAFAALPADRIRPPAAPAKPEPAMALAGAPAVAESAAPARAEPAPLPQARPTPVRRLAAAEPLVGDGREAR